MKQAEIVRKILKAMGVQSIGVYVMNQKTHIILNCEFESSREDAKEFLQTHLNDEVVIL